MTFPPQAEAQDVPIEWKQNLEPTQPIIEMGTLQGKTDIATIKKLSKRTVLYLGAGFSKNYASIENTEQLNSSPFYKSDTLQLNSRYLFSTEGNWAGYALGSVDLAVADQANLADGFSMIASAGASYSINPKLKFSLGLLTTQSLSMHTQAMPIIGIDWDITERLKLRTLNGAFLTYDMGLSTQFDLSVQYRNQAFAVENHKGTVFMKMDETILMEESSVVGIFGVKHNWKDVFSIRAFAEIIGNREFEINLDEPELQKIPVKDNALSFGVEGGIRF